LDEAVIKYYRRLLKNGFKHAGSLDSPDIFLDSVGEKIPVCGHSERNYLHLFIKIANGLIDNIKYTCTCDPTANVVVEILCSLVEGKPVEHVIELTEESFLMMLGGGDDDFRKKSRGAIELLNRGLARYKSRAT
jgi:NifU-like protein involved in Fe-S cluster formation